MVVGCIRSVLLFYALGLRPVLDEFKRGNLPFQLEATDVGERLVHLRCRSKGKKSLLVRLGWKWGDLASGFHRTPLDRTSRLEIVDGIGDRDDPKPIRGEAFGLVLYGDSATASECLPIRVDLDCRGALNLLALKSFQKLR